MTKSADESAATKRRRRAGVFDRWHTREPLPEGQRCPGKTCRNVAYKQAARHGVGMRWTARFVDDQGREQSKGFAAKADAQSWLDTQVSSLVRGDFVSPDRSAMTFGTLATKWFESLTNAASTVRSYESVLDTHIRPRWSGVKLSDFEHSAYAGWLSNLRKANGEPLSPSSVRHVHVIMRMILDLAVRDSRMPRNLCDGVRLPKARPATQRFLTKDELARLVAAADHLAVERHRIQRAGRRAERTPIEQDKDGRNVIPTAPESVDGLMLRVLAGTGIRWGELAGLRIECLDLRKRRLTICRSASEVNGSVEWSDTKNHESRVVAFPRSLVPALREQVKDRPADALVFPTRTGQPHRNSGWSKRVFGPAVKLAQLAPLTIHDLRDTFASLAVAAGSNVKLLQRQLGHASAAMTLDIYSGLFEDDLDTITDAMDAG
ncbi:tyrosine-type recombinase/integrase [Nocardia aurea]|uniref:tyrosine-type recombinase/integrase n=1 Tax=Nocardia aurea TaxID=2144174 RepID=UPI0033BF70F1